MRKKSTVFTQNCKQMSNIYIPGRPNNWGHFVLRLVTLEILIRSASNLAQIKVISFLTLNHNLFDSNLESKVAPSSE